MEAKPLKNENPAGGLVKVAFCVGTGGDAFIERLNAVSIGGELFVLENSPFYVYGVSYKDVVHAASQGGDVVFDSVFKRGGHSTYRVKLASGIGREQFQQYWPQLAALGCTYEWSASNERPLYAIDVPPESDVFEVYRVLEEIEAIGVWQFEEGDCQLPAER